MKRWMTKFGLCGAAIFAVIPHAGSSGMALGQSREPTSTQVAGNVIRANKYIHTVQDLDKSYAFYHGALGLELVDAKEAPKRLTGVTDEHNVNVSKLTNTPGSKMRGVQFKIPGSDLILELVEFTSGDRKVVPSQVQDPGATLLVLTIRDMESTLAAVERAGATPLTTGGKPIAEHRGNRDTKNMWMRDPDGFFFEITEATPAPESSAPSSSKILTGRFAQIIGDTDKTIQFYNTLLRTEGKAGAFTGSELMMRIGGTLGGQVRPSRVPIPGTSQTLELLEFKDIERKSLDARIQDPGARAIAFEVRDLGVLLNDLKARGVQIVSTGGEPVKRPDGGDVVFVRDPNGLYLELTQVTR